MEKKETKKSVRRLKAGDVVYMEYMGENKPCDKAVALLLNPVTIKEGCTVKDFHTLYAIDTVTEKFIPAGPIKDATAKIERVTGSLKAWYYEKILELCRKPEQKPEPENIWVVFDESLGDYSLAGRRIRLFKDEDEARKAFDETVEVTRRVRSAEGWEIDENEDFFETYPDGSWGTSHETVELKKCKIGEGIWLHE